MADNDQDDDNVFIGDGPFPRGNGNVVIRPGAGGHIRIDGSGGGIAIGNDAQAGEGSISIGNRSGAGRRSDMAQQRWWHGPWTVTLVAGTLAAIVSGALLSLLHLV